MQDIYLLTDGQREGPYSEEQIQKALGEGSISTDNPAWHEGLTDWTTVGDLVTASEEEAEDDNQGSLESETSALGVNPESSPNTDQNRQSSVTYLNRLKAMAAIFLCSIAFGLSMGIGIGLVRPHATTSSVPTPAFLAVSSALASSATPTSSPEPTVEATTPDRTVAHKRVWFKVYEPAQEPHGAWFGYLCNEATGVKTDIIVDFGRELNLGKDDRLEGVYVPTSETGRWNDTPFRIYHLQRDFKMVDPLSVQD